MSGLSPAITNLAIILGMMQVSKKIAFDDPDVLFIVRCLYLASNLIIFSIWFYVRTRVNAKKDMTTLEYTEPAPMGSGDPPKVVTTTYHAYDIGQINQAMRGQLTGMAMLAFMHLYLKYANPLLIQSIIPLKSALESNLAKVYIWNKAPIGDLKRPWKSSAGFMGMGGGETKTDKKSIEEAKRANRSKED